MQIINIGTYLFKRNFFNCILVCDENILMCNKLANNSKCSCQLNFGGYHK